MILKYFFSILLTLFVVSKIKTADFLYCSNSTTSTVIYRAVVNTHVVAMNNISLDTLKFNTSKSFFQWQRQEKSQELAKKYPNAQIIRSEVSDDQIGNFNHYNASTDSLFSRRIFLGLDKVYLIKARAPHIHWNISDSTKKIGNYTVKKATAHFRGRNYTAWFAPKIPVPYGPWKLIGLPGLILQAYDSGRNIRFTAQKVTFSSGKDSIESMPSNGKEEDISLNEYQKIIIHLKKLQMKKANKIMRKYRHKYGNRIKFKIKNTKHSEPMEIFSDTTSQ